MWLLALNKNNGKQALECSGCFRAPVNMVLGRRETGSNEPIMETLGVDLKNGYTRKLESLEKVQYELTDRATSNNLKCGASKTSP